MNRYRWFQLTQNYHAALATMLFEIETAISRDLHNQWDDEYLIQVVTDVKHAYDQLHQFEREHNL